MPTLVLVRHGQSIWNLENRFTGWVDVPLSEKGLDEARMAGAKLAGMRFDVGYTSALRRAQHTMELLMEAASWGFPVIRDQALNERDYGDLAGLNKDDMRAKYGEEQVHIWRRSFDVPPPGGESLKDTAARSVPFYERAILGDIKQGKSVLVAAHGNSNRSIAMAIEGLSPDEVIALELATGVPRIYELENDGKLISVRNMD